MKFTIRTESNFWGDGEFCEFGTWEDAAKFILSCGREIADDDGRSARKMNLDEAIQAAHEELEEARP